MWDSEKFQAAVETKIRKGDIIVQEGLIYAHLEG